MKRMLITCVAVLGLLPAGAMAAHAGASASRAELRDFVCQRALDPPARAISVTAVMRPVTGTQKMEMEVVLLSRAPTSGSFMPVSVPAQSKLDTWITPPNPTLGQRSGDVWNVQVPVADLAAPATYRFQVAFRWLGATGNVLSTAVHTSHSCYEPELRPDLYVQSFTVQPISGHPARNHYVVVIGNDGLTAARSFEVEFDHAGHIVTDEIDRLDAHAHTTLTFTGAACAATDPPTVTLDPQHVVDDLNTTKLTATASCPAPAAGTSVSG
ncbi:MAG TPA: CARDB domain-containing protein [Solirubrobacteraceae bacterium]|jgi:hypothetical protein|nr:CARDB domain-containing protein [Solirubrobacteraceae bacterium]